MNVSKKYFILTFLFCVIYILSSSPGWSQYAPRPKPLRSTPAKRRAKEKRYKYTRIHDVNNDGKVDHKDRLIWLRRKGGNYDAVYVSTENESIVDVMDIDGDGNVESWEMEEFYNTYDLNGDGILQDEEIEAAAY